MEKINLKVKGMHCPSCSILIKDELENLKGVESVKVSYEKGKVSVVFDKLKISQKQIKGSILKEGYRVNQYA